MLGFLREIAGRCLPQTMRGRGRGSRNSNCRLAVECLQERVLPSTNLVFVNPGHQLVIRGTTGNDVVQISQTPGQLRVDYNGQTFRFASKGVNVIDFNGQAGDDRFTNSSSVSVLANGGLGNDTLTGGTGNDRLLGGAGDDSLFGGGGNDALFGQNGNDVIQGGIGDDSIAGGAGNDDLQGQGGIDDITGDDGNDLIRGGNGDDHLHGGRGDDRLFGQNGNDHLFGEDGDDRIRGESGNDDLHGGIGDDHLWGDDGDDHLNGDLGKDFDDGGAGQDTAFDLSGDSSSGCEVRHDHNGDELYAQLTGPGTALGQAKFETEVEHGVTQKKLELQISGASSNQSFAVVVDGVVVGQLVTNNLGNAAVELRSGSLQVAAGSTVLVRDSLGNVLVSGSFGFEAEDAENEITLLANLSGSGAALGSAKFESGHDNGTAPTELEVKIKSGPASQTLNVLVDGNIVGQITTDAAGTGELTLTNLTFEVQVGVTLDVKDLAGNVILAGTFQSV